MREKIRQLLIATADAKAAAQATGELSAARATRTTGVRAARTSFLPDGRPSMNLATGGLSL